ncbi:MAG: hypothetical protein WA667_26270, partial [Candidatus Nitrosopolaris sp.]
MYDKEVQMLRVRLMIKFKSNAFHYKLMLLGYRPEKEEFLSLTQSPLSFEQLCPRWARKLRIG